MWYSFTIKNKIFSLLHDKANKKFKMDNGKSYFEFSGRLSLSIIL